jgi:hypothetical protein
MLSREILALAGSMSTAPDPGTGWPELPGDAAIILLQNAIKFCYNTKSKSELANTQGFTGLWLVSKAPKNLVFRRIQWQTQSDKSKENATIATFGKH